MAVKNDTKPNVSVILPYFEGAAWLARSAQSVIAQGDDVSWELIIIDDGSVHSPLPIVESLQNEHVRLIRAEHGGKGAALNRGVAEARADIVCFIDQDDIMNPGRLKLQVSAFTVNPQVDVVYSDYERVHDDGSLIDRFISHHASRQECLGRMAKSTGLVSMQTIMMKKDMFNQLGGFSTDIQLTGLDDAEFFIRLFSSETALHYVPGTVQKWVLHGNNYSESANFQETRLVLLKYLTSYAQNNPAVRKVLPCFKYHSFFMRGLFFLERGMPSEALPEFTRAIKLRPFNVNGYYLLVKSWLKKQKIYYR
jgi:glycosyltransferase involved in cell wall biosynthesis